MYKMAERAKLQAKKWANVTEFLLFYEVCKSTGPKMAAHTYSILKKLKSYS